MTAEHLEALVLQPAQRAWRDKLQRSQIEALAASDGWTALDGEVVVGCGGVIDHGGGRGEAWALLAGDAGAQLVPITRAVRRFLAAAPYRRVEAVTACNFPPGRRWVTMLGFRFEGLMSAYCDDGSDAERWART